MKLDNRKLIFILGRAKSNKLKQTVLLCIGLPVTPCHKNSRKSANKVGLDPLMQRLNSGQAGCALAKKDWATEIAYAEYIGEIVENRL